MSRRVLIVDDDPVNRLVATAQIQELGYSAEAADSGEAALAALAREPYDAVLLDCEMPGLDGYETCRRLRCREGNGGRRARVIALTAHTAIEERERCLAAGMDGHLTKPVRSAELAAVLKRWLEEDGDGLQTLPPAEPDPIEERLEALERLGAATGEDVLGQVAESFLQRGAKDLAALREALARGDGAAFAAAAHSLAGSSGILGAAGLSMGCAELEELARRGDLAACGPRLDAVEQAWRQVADRLSAGSLNISMRRPTTNVEPKIRS
ncbi:MAG TPA: response regulator [Thermoanaerobaculia bacterium]|nr:response regulator [Thermoanaerobaculia bacterium]